MEFMPKLRFSNFKGNWSEYQIGDIFDFYTTNSLSRDELNYNGGEVKNIHYGDIHMKFTTIVDVGKSEIPYINKNIDLSKISDENYCIDGDVIFADASEDYSDIGKAIELKNINGDKIVSGLHTILARDNKKLTSKGFRGYMFLPEIVRKQIKVLAVGSKVLGISKANLAKVKVYIPSKEEQKKIANFINLIDQKIEKQKERIDSIKSYNLGIKQKIFSQEIRLKNDNGDNYEEWKEVKLSSVLKERKEYDIKESNYTHVTLSKEGIYDKGERYNRDFLVKTEDKKYKVTKKYDICYNPANLKFGVISLNMYGDAIFSPIYVTFEVNKAYDPVFVGYFVTRVDFINKIRKYEEGTVYERMAVKSEDFLKYSDRLPCLDEQIKISKFFIKLDSKLKFEEEKLNSLQYFRKGIIQKMFV